LKAAPNFPIRQPQVHRRTHFLTLLLRFPDLEQIPQQAKVSDDRGALKVLAKTNPSLPVVEGRCRPARTGQTAQHRGESV
jgi:hypothetical protein